MAASICIVLIMKRFIGVKMMTNILIVDDDINVLKLVNIHLAKEGFHVIQAKDGIEALEAFRDQTFHLAVVDVMMPFIDGFELTKKIREQYIIPVILLTAKNQLDDKEEGFQSGADDYMVKPFEPKELVLRMNALLRLYHNQPKELIIKVGNTTINKNNYEVQIDNQTIILPLKEFELLYYLLSKPMQVFSREQLIEQIWGFDYEGDDRTVDVHIKRIRERFSTLTDDFQIKTIRGVGYLLEVNHT